MSTIISFMANSTASSMAKLTSRLTVSSIILLTMMFMFPVNSIRAQSDDPNSNTAINNEDKSASNSHRNISSNECLQKLSDDDTVIASIAFKDGVTGFAQLEELVKRNPWGSITDVTKKEIEQQLNTQSPFLIITLTKQQTLKLDEHRDIIRWVLVQSTTKSCE